MCWGLPAQGRGHRPYLHELDVSEEAAHWHRLVAVVVEKDAVVHLQWRRVALLQVRRRPVPLRAATVGVSSRRGPASRRGRPVLSLYRAGVTHGSTVPLGESCGPLRSGATGFLSRKPGPVLGRCQRLTLTRGLGGRCGRSSAVTLGDGFLEF